MSKNTMRGIAGNGKYLRKVAGKCSKPQKETTELSLKIFFKIYKKCTASPNEAMQHFVIFLREK